MATSLQQIQDTLASSRTTGAKPVTMEQIPDATIDVRGGVSSALEIEPLGQKKKKTTSPSVQSSTATLSTEEYFSDLLDGLNYGNANSINNFKNSISERINETDSQTLASFNTQPVSQNTSVTTVDDGGDSPFNQFENYFGGTGAAESGVEDTPVASSAAYEEFTSMPSYSQNAALSLTSSLPGMINAYSRGADLSSMALSSLGIPSYNSYMDTFNINNPIDAVNAINAVTNVAQLASRYSSFATATSGLENFISNAGKNLEEGLQGVVSVVTNPKGAIEAYGRQLEYGTQNPHTRSFDLPSGSVSYVFDETGRLSTGSLVGSLVRGTPIGGVFSAAQGLMQATGFTDEISVRAQQMSDAFSLNGISYSGGVTGYATPEGKSFIDVNFTNDYTEQYGSEIANFNNQYDLSQLTGSIEDLTLNDFAKASVVQNYPDLEYEEDLLDASKKSLAETAVSLGIARDIRDAMKVDPSKLMAERISENVKDINQSTMAEINAVFENLYGVDTTDLSIETGIAAGYLSDAKIASLSPLAVAQSFGFLANTPEKQTAVSMQGSVDTAGDFDLFATGSGFLDPSFEVDEPTGPAEAYDPNQTGPGYTTGFDPDTGEGDNVGDRGDPDGSVDTSAQTGVAGTDMSSDETSMDEPTGEDVDIGDDIGDDVGDE